MEPSSVGGGGYFIDSYAGVTAANPGLIRGREGTLNYGSTFGNFFATLPMAAAATTATAGTAAGVAGATPNSNNFPALAAATNKPPRKRYFYDLGILFEKKFIKAQLW